MHEDEKLERAAMLVVICGYILWVLGLVGLTFLVLLIFQGSGVMQSLGTAAVLVALFIHLMRCDLL